MNGTVGPEPVQRTVCSLCGLAWDKHLETAELRCLSESDEPTIHMVLAEVSMYDCILALQIDRRGPMGPQGPMGPLGMSGSVEDHTHWTGSRMTGEGIPKLAP